MPFAVGGQASAAVVEDATLFVYEGAPHGITDIHKARLDRDLPDFVKASRGRGEPTTRRAGLEHGGVGPLLFLSGSEDHIIRPSVQASNAKHYEGKGTITEHDTYEGRPHLMVAGAGWEEIADRALEWALANAAWTPAAASADA